MQGTEHDNNAQEQLDELRDAVLNDWLIVVGQVTRTQLAMEASVSWRVTKPLRIARTFQRKSAELGVIPATQLAAAALADRLRRS